MIQVLIVSPSPALRAGLLALLNAEEDMEVVASAGKLSTLDELSTAQVLVVSAGVLAGALPRDISILLVGEEVSEARILAQAALPSWGIISPDAPAETLGAAIRALAQGLIIATPDIHRELLRQTAPTERKPLDEGLERLTARELDVLQEIAQGLTNKQIAYRLGISQHTVKYHIAAIYSKLGASNRAEATRTGARLGYLSL